MLDRPTGILRIIETTDLHMQLLGYDYFADQPQDGTGLIPLADQIAHCRQEPGITSILCDNGDFLQGNPLADHIMQSPAQRAAHPMIHAMNTLGYDAIGLGNHEFNYGLAALAEVLGALNAPVTCANIDCVDGPDLAAPFVILDRMISCTDGQERPIKIGIFGLVPPQILQWDKAHLSGRLSVADMIATAENIVPKLKSADADLVVALAHTGLGPEKAEPGMENAAIPLAAIPDIDVLLTGHIHDQFPGTDHAATDIVDPIAGTIHGTPTVMAGFIGNALGLVDVTLAWGENTWTVTDHCTRLAHAISQPSEPSPLQTDLIDSVTPLHTRILSEIRKPIAQTHHPIHSYFANFGPDATQDILARAQTAHIARALAGTAFAELPILSATTPYRAGGRGGPANYVDIPPGPVTISDIAAIFPFANQLCALRRTGAELRRWLERCASHFAQIKPGEHDQPLLQKGSPSYNCDLITGLDYQFDLSEPPRFSTEGQSINPQATRLRYLQHKGRDVQDDDKFVVAVNSYRLSGAGGFEPGATRDTLYMSDQLTRDILIDDLSKRGTIDPPTPHQSRLAHLTDTSAVFCSAPAAKNHLFDGVVHLGPAKNGFDLYRLIL